MSAGWGGRHGFAVRAGRFLARRRSRCSRLAGWSVLEAGQTFLPGTPWPGPWTTDSSPDAPMWGCGGSGPRARRCSSGRTAPRGCTGGRRAGRAAAGPAGTRGGAAGGARGGRRGAVGADPAGGDRPGRLRRPGHGLPLVRVHRRRGAGRSLLARARRCCWSSRPRWSPGWRCSLVTLGPLARRQEAFLVADEALADRARAPSARGCGTSRRPARRTGSPPTPAALVDAELRGPRAPGPLGRARVVGLALGGHLPSSCSWPPPPGSWPTASPPARWSAPSPTSPSPCSPPCSDLIHGLGTSGSRLAVVLRRLLPPGGPPRHGAPRLAAPRRRRRPALDQPRPAPITDTSPARRPAPARPRPTPRPVPHLRHLRLRPLRSPRRRRPHLTLPPGTHLAVVGPSGIGKSTLTGLVAGLLHPRRGTIRFCGGPVPGAEAAARRVLIPQEAYVFGGTLAREPRLPAAGTRARGGAAAPPPTAVGLAAADGRAGRAGAPRSTRRRCRRASAS